MNSQSRLRRRAISLLLCLSGVTIGAPPAHAQVPAPAQAAFTHYCATLEARLALQHRSAAGFLAGGAPQLENQQLLSGELVVEQLTPSGGLTVPGGLIHHWRGTAFVPGAHAADFVHLLSDLPAYPRWYAPQVLSASAGPWQGSSTDIRMRLSQHHVLTVVMDLHGRLTLGMLDAAHGYSASRSQRVDELGGPQGRDGPLPPDEQHGFLWQLNSYWSYEERDGGLLLQIEAVSLTRAIPHGLGWIVEPFVQSVPRESLAFTLSSTQKALEHPTEASR